MKWQVCVTYSFGRTDQGREIAFTLDAAEETQAREQVKDRMKEVRPIPPITWEIVVLAPIPAGPFQHGGQMTDGGFLFPCGCLMEPTGKLRRCPAHAKQDGVGDEAIVEAVTALGLLKEKRTEYTCETCRTTTQARPLIGDYAGRFTFPRDWESEEWQQMTPPRSFGKSVFCSRLCRGKWIVKTANTLRRP